MPNNSPTAAGPSSRESNARRVELVDAINQVFTLFRLNYHNQYLKAFGNTAELNEVKRLWLEMLGRFEPAAILSAAKTVIENSEFLPTLHTMIHNCERASSRGGLPDVHTAYLEACRAPSPKAAYHWSHPAVYYTGKACDWFFLQTNPEAVAYPVFKQKYEEICADVRSGAILPPIEVPALPETSEQPLDRQTNQTRLNALRASLDL